MSSPLPILDIRLWRTNPQAFASKLRHACHKIGFFLLRHDMPPSLPQRQLDECRYFFNKLPRSTKMSLSYENSPAFRGYMPLGVENTSGRIDVRESFEVGPEEAETTVKKAWPPYERLRGANPWPDDDQPSLRECVKEYSSHVVRIADCLRHAMCLSLGASSGAETDDIHSLFDDPHWMLRMISYPPTTTTAAETTKETTTSKPTIDGMTSSEMTLGVGAHTDSNFLTLVLQDDVGGLQVYTDGTWIDVPSNIPDVLVCNVGEQAEILSKGYFLATPHRVAISPTRHRSRSSVATFYNPELSASLTPMTVSPELPWEREYEPWRMGRNSMLGCCGENTFKSLARSHPVVFRKHHGDLRLLEDGRVVKLDDGGGEM